MKLLLILLYPMLKMKSYRFICVALVSCLLVSACRNGNENEMRVAISFKIQATENDRVDLYYSHSKDSVFSEKRKMSETYEGGSLQLIHFSLPLEKLNSFRIDLSNNPLQKQCYLSELTITYNRKELEVTPELLPVFFTLNEYLSNTPETETFFISEVNGRKDPYLTAKPLLLKRIEIDY